MDKIDSFRDDDRTEILATAEGEGSDFGHPFRYDRILAADDKQVIGRMDDSVAAVPRIIRRVAGVDCDGSNTGAIGEITVVDG